MPEKINEEQKKVVKQCTSCKDITTIVNMMPALNFPVRSVKDSPPSFQSKQGLQGLVPALAKC
jgi:hypothetical protein